MSIKYYNLKIDGKFFKNFYLKWMLLSINLIDVTFVHWF